MRKSWVWWQSLFDRYTSVIVVILLALVTLLMFRGVFSGYAIIDSNHLYNFEPWIHYSLPTSGNSNYILSDNIDALTTSMAQTENIRHGQFNLWFYNDKLGSAGLLNMYHTLSYPLRIIPWILFGVPVGLTIETLGKFFVSAVFMYLFLKKIKLSTPVSAAVAIGYAFSTSHISSYSNPFSTGPLMAPVLFYFIERLLQSNRWKDSLWLTIGTLALVSSGLPHLVVFFCFWATIFVIYRLFWIPGERTALIKKLLLSGMLSLAIFSPFLLGTIDYINNGIDLGYRQNYGIRQNEVLSLSNLFFGNIYGHPLKEAARWIHGTYVNTTVFVGYITAISALTGGVWLAIKRNKYALFFLVGTAVLLGEIYQFPGENVELFFNQLPLFNSNPAIYQKVVFQFFVAIMGGLGLNYFWSLPIKNWAIRRRMFGLLCLAVLGSIFLFNYIIHLQPLDSLYVQKYVLFSLGIALGSLGLFFILLLTDHSGTTPKSRAIQCILTILLFSIYITEPLVNSRDWFGYAKPNTFYPQTEVTDYLQQNIGEGRLISLGMAAVPSTLSEYDLPVAIGRGSPKHNYLELFRTAWPDLHLAHPTQSLFPEYETNFNSPIFDLADVRYVVASQNLDADRIKKTFGDRVSVHSLRGGKILEILPTPTHVHLAKDAVFFDSAEEMAAQFSGDWNIDTNIAFLERKIFPVAGDDFSRQVFVSQPIGAVSGYIQQPNLIRFTADLSEPGYVVISSAYFPGWQAFINGQRTELFAAYGCLQALKIDSSGHFEIELKYRPQSYVIGLPLSLFGLAAFISCAWFFRRQRRGQE